MISITIQTLKQEVLSALRARGVEAPSGFTHPMVDGVHQQDPEHRGHAINRATLARGAGERH